MKDRRLSSLLRRYLGLRLLFPLAAAILCISASLWFRTAASIGARQYQEAVTVSRFCAMYLTSAKEALGFFIASSTSEEFSKAAAEFMAQNTTFVRLSLLDARGNVLSEVPGETSHTVYSRWTPAILEDSRARMAFSLPYVSSSSGKLAVSVFRSVWNGRIITGELDLDALRDFVSVSAPGHSRRRSIVITDGYGNVVVHPDPQVLARQSNLGNYPPIARALRGTVGSLQTARFGGSRSILCTAVVANENWVVLVAWPLWDQVFDVVLNAGSVLLLLLMILGIVLFLLDRTIRRDVVGPLMQFVGETERLAAGDTDFNHPLDAPFVELERMHRSFHSMAETVVRREAALRESEENIAVTLRSIGDAVIATDVERRVTRMNPAAEVLTGWVFADAAGRLLSDVFRIVDCETRRPVIDTEDPASDAGSVSSAGSGTVLRSRDGGEHRISESAAPIRDSAGNNIGTVVVFRDVSEEYRMQRELQEERERLSNVIDGTSSGIWDWNVRTGEIVYNERWAEILGYTLAELSPVSSETWRSMTYPEDLERADRQLEDYLAGKTKMYSTEIRMKHKDGSWIWVLDRGRVFEWDEKGRPLRMFGTHTDITDLKRNEDRIRRLLDEKNLLLREVHHRIKNNMNTIASLLSMQMNLGSSQEPKNVLRDARGRVMSMLAIYDTLYRSSDYRNISVRVYLNGLIDQAVSTLSGSSPSAVRITVERRIEDCILDARTLFPVGLIVNECITNIFKYAFPGRGEGNVLISFTRNANLCELQVNDDGVGLPEKILDGSSEGFGMKLLRALVEQLEGSLSVTGTEGTSFRVVFPVFSPEEGAQAQDGRAGERRV